MGISLGGGGDNFLDRLIKEKSIDPFPGLKVRDQFDVFPQDFLETFKDASKSLNQIPSVQPGFREFVTSGTRELAEAFIDGFQESKGRLPTQNEVSQFVNENLTQDFARRIQKGEQPRTRTRTELVDPFLRSIGPTDEEIAAKTKGITEGALSRFNEIFDKLEPQVAGRVRRELAPLRRRSIADEATLGGRLLSPISRGRESAISRSDEREANAVKDILAGLSGERARSELDILKFGEGLSAAERRARELTSRFRQSFGFEKEKFQNEQDLLNRQLKLSEQLGRLQANASRRSTGPLDIFNTILGGAGAIGGLFGGLGSAKSAGLFGK